jgi:hypothetical protein
MRTWMLVFIPFLVVLACRPSIALQPDIAATAEAQSTRIAHMEATVKALHVPTSTPVPTYTATPWPTATPTPTSQYTMTPTPSPTRTPISVPTPTPYPTKPGATPAAMLQTYATRFRMGIIAATKHFEEKYGSRATDYAVYIVDEGSSGERNLLIQYAVLSDTEESLPDEGERIEEMLRAVAQESSGIFYQPTQVWMFEYKNRPFDDPDEQPPTSRYQTACVVPFDKLDDWCQQKIDRETFLNTWSCVSPGG